MARVGPKSGPKAFVEPIVLETDALLEKIAKIEELGEEVVTDRHQLVDLDKKKNGNREAIRSLKKKEVKGFEKSWLCIGNTFFKMEDKNINQILQQDQRNLAEEIEKTRNGLKDKVSRLHELEGLPDIDRFSIASLTQEERKFVNL